MVAIDHRFLLGQSVQARRSDGNWHDAVIIDANIHNPDAFWQPPHENDTIQVMFADRVTRSYRLQQDLSEVLSPMVWTEGLIARRKKELFQTLPAETTERSLPIPNDLDASQEEPSSMSSFDRAALDEHCRRMAKPPKRQLSGTGLSPLAHKKSKKGSGLPACMDFDSDLDDETLIAACDAFGSGRTKG